MMLRLRLDRTTAMAVLGAGVVLEGLLFVAGAVVGSAWRAGVPARSRRASSPGDQTVIAAGRDARRPAGEDARTPYRYRDDVDPLAEFFVLHDWAPAPPDYRVLIRDAADRAALPPSLVEAVARVESDFDPRLVSHKGARGIMQVMPATGARFGVAADRLFDPRDNLAAGTAYLAWLLDRYRGDLDLALAAYNAGEGAVDGHGGIPPYRETQQYVRRVRAALLDIEAGRAGPSTSLRASSPAGPPPARRRL